MADYHWRAFRLPCEDGKTRTIRVKCYTYDGKMAADTYFSVQLEAWPRATWINALHVNPSI